MEMIGKEFLDRFHHYIHQWWPARELLEKAISKRFEVEIFVSFSLKNFFI